MHRNKFLVWKQLLNSEHLCRRPVDNSQWVNIESKPSWKQHTDQLYKKLCSSICVIRKILQGSKQPTDSKNLLTVHCLSPQQQTNIVGWGGRETSRNNLERILMHGTRVARCWVALQWSLQIPYSHLIIPLHFRNLIRRNVSTLLTRHQDQDLPAQRKQRHFV